MKYDIWAEGYACTGESAGATLIGQEHAESFQAACNKHAFYDADFDRLYDPKCLTYWGCKLFDNKQDAQRSFG